MYKGVRKGLDKRIVEGVLRWFGHVERMEDRQESLCRSVLVSVQSLRKKELNVRQARRMVQDRS